MKRYNVQMNVEAQVTDKFKIGMNMNGRIKQLKNPGVPGTDDYSNPTAATYRNLTGLSVRLPMTILTIRHQ